MFTYPEPHTCTRGCDHDPDLFDFAEWLDQPALRNLPENYSHAAIVKMYEEGWDFSPPPIEFGDQLILPDGRLVLYVGPSLREGIHEVVTRGGDGEWLTKRLSVGVNVLMEARPVSSHSH